MAHQSPPLVTLGQSHKTLRLDDFTVVRKDVIKLNKLKGTLNYSHSLEKVHEIIVRLIKIMFSSMVAKAKLSSPEQSHAILNR